MSYYIAFIMLSLSLSQSIITNCSAEQRRVRRRISPILQLQQPTQDTQQSQLPNEQEFQKQCCQLNNKINEVDEIAQIINWNDYYRISSRDIQVFNALLSNAAMTRSEINATTRTKEHFEKIKLSIDALCGICEWLYETLQKQQASRYQFLYLP